MIKFKVDVNPFKREAIVKCDINNSEYTETIYYDDNDEWFNFDMDDYNFDIHFLYDHEFSVSIYHVLEGNHVDYENPCDVELTFKMTE